MRLKAILLCAFPLGLAIQLQSASTSFPIVTTQGTVFDAGGQTLYAAGTNLCAAPACKRRLRIAG